MSTIVRVIGLRLFHEHDSAGNTLYERNGAICWAETLS